ncbi:DinB family protein [Spirosoma soli]|uniref:DinB family protein n=1 Tax=Spirosoma soli TaxID=1770529 RepID=A0ABW5LYI7_9BACT
MTTEFLIQLWQINQSTVSGPIRKLTAENYRNRLTPETASAGFIALHTAEAMHRFAKIMFNREITIPFQATGGVSDDGKQLDLSSIQQAVDDSFAMIADHIRQTNDAQWAETIASPFGEVSRMQVLVFLMHHNSYHAGQISQAIKKGKAYDLQSA